jgi:large subunit ribosomal protein L3
MRFHQIRQEHTDGYTALQVGAGEAKLKNVSPTLKGHYAKAGVPPKRCVGEFRVTPDALLPMGFLLKAQHFLAGIFTLILTLYSRHC